MHNYTKNDLKHVNWKRIYCKNHPKRRAAVWINPPIGNCFCVKCYHKLQRMALGLSPTRGEWKTEGG
jgi:hypothetical protein